MVRAFWIFSCERGISSNILKSEVSQNNNTINFTMASSTSFAPNDDTSTTPLLYSALSAYLSPLLENHAKGSLILYDDLTNAWDAAQAVLVTKKGSEDAAVHASITKRVSDLHQSQLTAYREAAGADLSQFAERVDLPERSKPITNKIAARDYLKLCLKHVESHSDKPDWQNVSEMWEPLCKSVVTKRVNQILLEEKRQRLKAQEERQTQDPGEVEEKKENTSEHPEEGEAGNEEEGARTEDEADQEQEGEGGGEDTTPHETADEDEDGEMPDVEQDVTMDTPDEKPKPKAIKKPLGIKKRSAAAASAAGKKALVKKKVGGTRGRKVGPRARRGGRGGAGAPK